jgi:hypothetical protein
MVGDVVTDAIVEGRALGLRNALRASLSAARLDRVDTSLDQRAALLGVFARGGEADLWVWTEAHVPRLAVHAPPEDPPAAAAGCDPEIQIAAVREVARPLEVPHPHGR